MNIDDWTGTEIGDQIIDDAAHWVAALDAENANVQVISENSPKAITDIELSFYTWLNQDPVHQIAFAQVSELWAKTACLKHVEHLLVPSQVLAFPKCFSKRTKRANHNVLLDVPLLQEQHIESAAPAWAYNIVIGMISFGFVVSFLPIPLI